ncbi:hypothetical protein K492DRAFT_209607 [Lichtheimia hyalospora FSU 10163]|nr:hypothetical protein K492DRAFT_209607 [Lichtheimia hyalospora FSU 10163]
MPVQAPVSEQTTTPSSNHVSSDHATTPMKKECESEAAAAPSNDTSNKSKLEENDDYKSTVAALNVLRRQLQQANKDVETLYTLKQQALDHPFQFLTDLKEKKTRHRVPKLQKIACAPSIDWTKYRYIPEHRMMERAAMLSALVQGTLKQPPVFRNVLDYPSSSHLRQEPSSPSSTVSHMQKEMARVSRIVGQVPSTRASSVDLSDKESDDEGQPTTTGSEMGMFAGKGKGKRRMSTTQTGPITPSDFSYGTMLSATPRNEMEEDTAGTMEHRAATYNQPWTDEEQRRLEELLEVYPDEPVQSQRFLKISKALGTRTTKQVASRVQKYFIKLAKLGLPVPGRVSIPPSSLPKAKRKVTKVKGRGGNTAAATAAAAAARAAKPSSRASGPGYNAMVSGGITNTRISGTHYLTAQAPAAALMSDDEDDVKKTMLKVAKPDSTQTTNADTGSNSEVAIHEGYACDACGVEPIVGVRYKCAVCDISEEVDLCSKCMAVGTFRNDHHTPEHSFEAIHVANALPYYADTDYDTSAYLGEYSYLGM